MAGGHLLKKPEIRPVVENAAHLRGFSGVQSANTAGWIWHPVGCARKGLGAAIVLVSVIAMGRW